MTRPGIEQKSPGPFADILPTKPITATQAKYNKIANVLCRDRDETINHIISEHNKQALREYKTRHDWVGNMIHGLWTRVLQRAYFF